MESAVALSHPHDAASELETSHSNRPGVLGYLKEGYAGAAVNIKAHGWSQLLLTHPANHTPLHIQLTSETTQHVPTLLSVLVSTVLAFSVATPTDIIVAPYPARSRRSPRRAPARTGRPTAATRCRTGRLGSTHHNRGLTAPRTARTTHPTMADRPPMNCRDPGYLCSSSKPRCTVRSTVCSLGIYHREWEAYYSTPTGTRGRVDRPSEVGLAEHGKCCCVIM